MTQLQVDADYTMQPRWTHQLVKKLFPAFILVGIAYVGAVFWLLNSEPVAIVTAIVQDEKTFSEHLNRPSIRWWLPWKLTMNDEYGEASFVVFGERDGEHQCYRASVHRINGHWVIRNLVRVSFLCL